MKILSLFALISTVLFSGHLVAEEIAGKTMLARGSVLAGPDPEVDPRSLKRRSPIYDSDVVVRKLEDQIKSGVLGLTPVLNGTTPQRRS